MVPTPSLLALDFDGVICNGLVEYFQTAWRTYCQIWSPDTPTPPEGLAERFYRLRPVIETGWEMPVLIRAQMQGIDEAAILANWGQIAQHILVEDEIEPKILATKLDGLRDNWTATDLDEWLSLHGFYPGVIYKLKTLLDSPVRLFIITTKEGRFVRSLLQKQGLDVPDRQLFGKESGQPKHQVLRDLLVEYATEGQPPVIWFVEDRLKTLQNVQKYGELDEVGLYLADWGYNTASERQAAEEDDRIRVLSLEQFNQDFSSWDSTQRSVMCNSQ
ncbi:MAG TPA: HAD family hydrolase [Oscillatoriales cyanobacterium M59_W2019_021]|nr:HAD family hydrolase [Oscillatoriales cyanobacterium M4454_W2019_049]HIK50027.1 HAD family hydrolase [Oscillatoriales cyanobacterium M59_W2019_021]